MADGHERVPVGGVEPGAGEQQSPGEQAASDRENTGEEGEPGHVDCLGFEQDEAAGYRGQGDADHAGAVLLGDGEHGEHGDDGLTEVDARERELVGSCPPPLPGDWWVASGNRQR